MRWFGLLVVGAALCACGFPRPDRVGQGNGDGGVDAEPLPPGKLAAFGFTKAHNDKLVHDLRGSFSHDRTMVNSIGFELDRSAMTPSFATSDPNDVVEVGDEVQISETSVHEFTSPVVYRVTSAAGDVTTYNVTVESRGLPQPSNVVLGLIKDLVVGDVDGDDKPDIVLAGTNLTELVVYLNTTVVGLSTAEFATPVAVSPGLMSPSRVLLADLNGDSRPEMISASDSGAGLSILINATAQPGQVSFSIPQLQANFGVDVQAIAAGDLNGDGTLDVATSDVDQNLVYERLNLTATGDPTIDFLDVSTAMAGSLPADIALADFDGDHVLDTVVADQNQGLVQVIFGATQPSDVTPQFGGRRPANVPTPYRLAVTDIDHDGDLDLIVTTKSKSVVAVLTNDGHGQMDVASDMTTSPTVAVAVLDLDGDGYPDFVVASQGGALEPFINLADGTTTFHSQSTVTLSSEPIAAAVGDFNGDGIQDFVIANQTGFSTYLMGGP